MYVFSNFIPNKYVTFENEDPSWINKFIKTKLSGKMKFAKHLKEMMLLTINFKMQLMQFLTLAITGAIKGVYSAKLFEELL